MQEPTDPSDQASGLITQGNLSGSRPLNDFIQLIIPQGIIESGGHGNSPFKGHIHKAGFRGFLSADLDNRYKYTANAVTDKGGFVVCYFVTQAFTEIKISTYQSARHGQKRGLSSSLESLRNLIIRP